MTHLEHKQPIGWIEAIKKSVLSSSPLMHIPPKFNWEEMATFLFDLFDEKKIDISVSKVSLKDSAKVIDPDDHIAKFSLSPLSGNAFWSIKQEDLSSLAMYGFFNSEESLIEKTPFTHAFFEFLQKEAIAYLNKTPQFKNLAIQVEETDESEYEKLYCYQIGFHMQSQTIYSTLAISPNLLQDYSNHFKNDPSPYFEALSKNISVPMIMHAGSISLSLTEWKKIKHGDLILPDKLVYNPFKNLHQVVLMTDHTPLIEGKITKNKIQLLNYALYYKKEEPMIDKPFDDEEIDETTNIVSEDTVSEEKPIPIEKTELTINIELGSFQIPIEKLLALQPGMSLDLQMEPNNQVYLTCGGKTIAKAELISLDEQVGLRILEIG
ncbi:MAG TPA: FliM/FliN family flagellar motor switch protein [Chlamydiales bacterium]|nr:FliM/FliN family flagellar motor switch protein [Chlamydiales bacterium]